MSASRHVREKAARFLCAGSVQVECGDNGFSAVVHGDNALYVLRLSSTGWSCPCPSRRHCSHIEATRLVTGGDREAALGSELSAIVARHARRLRDPERIHWIRFHAAVCLSPSLIVYEALVGGIAVPANRLNNAFTRSLKLTGDIVLDDALALRLSAHGPLEKAS